MAASASQSTKPQRRNTYTLCALSVLFMSLFCLFLFNKRALEPTISIYRDLISQTPVPLTQSPPRSNEKLTGLRQSDESADLNTKISSISLRNESIEESNQETELPISSKSDVDDKATRQDAAPVVSLKPKNQGSDLSESIDGPIPSNEKISGLSSSKSDLDDKNRGKLEPLDVEEKDGKFSEITGGPVSSNEGVGGPIASKSDIGDRNRGKLESLGVEEKDDKLNQLNDGPFSSNERTGGPVASKSVLGDKNRGKLESFGVEENSDVISNAVAEKLRGCDIYKGTWVKDEGYPLYGPGTCPYVDEAFDCQSNGRPDYGYLNWRWKPDGCDLPRFNARDFLVRLRGKRLMLVGDSMNRNQFESLLCLLREALPDKSKMYEVHGYKITKGRGFYIFKFEEYNCTVEFVRSHFLVKEGIRVNAQGNSNPTLSIDRIDKSAGRWMKADILIFNTGHWWTHGKTSRGKNYYKEGDYVYPHFDAVEAYRRAIKTWAKWIKENSKEKLVFYRGYSSAHFRGGDWDSGGTCNGETEPVLRGAILKSYPQKMTIVEDVIKEMQVPVVLLNVTHLTNYRKDGHPSVYGKNVTGLKKVSTRKQDCSHWCLPGVPDAWNELIYTTLVARQT